MRALPTTNKCTQNGKPEYKYGIASIRKMLISVQPYDISGGWYSIETNGACASEVAYQTNLDQVAGIEKKNTI